MTEPYDDKLGYTDDGFVFLSTKEGIGCITVEDAQQLADQLAAGNAGQRWYAQELRKAAESAKKIREREE